MCNRYALEDLDEISELFNLRPMGSFGYPAAVYPRSPTPTLFANGEARLMQFGLAEKPTGPAYNNARIETPTKWPWLKAIEHSRCVVPLTSFYEPCYWGLSDGRQRWFHRPDKSLLFVAGIFRGDGMAMWLRPALPFVMEHGHHRSPLFIRPDAIDDWLAPDKMAADDAVELLRQSAEGPELVAGESVAMKTVTPKKVAEAVAKRDAQIVALRQVGTACGF